MNDRYWKITEKIVLLLNAIAAVALVIATLLLVRSSNSQEKLFTNQIQLLQEAVTSLQNSTKQFDKFIDDEILLAQKQKDLMESAVESSKGLVNSAKIYETLFDKILDVIHKNANHIEKIYFEWAIDQAEINCQSCSSCGAEPNTIMRRYLEVASRIEPIISDDLSAADYNSLAAIGSNYWDFSQLKSYCDKALERSSSTQDKYYTYLILGHLNFRDHKIDKQANLKIARDNFDLAVVDLTKYPMTDSNQYLIGYSYALRAAWEKYNKEDQEANNYKDLALKYWNKLKNHSTFLNLYIDYMLESASNDLKPEIPCLPHIPITNYGTTATTGQKTATISQPQIQESTTPESTPKPTPARRQR